MAHLTEKQRAYAQNRAAGVGKADSAIAAGYAQVSAAVTASKLEARADIKAAIKAARKSAKHPEPEQADDADRNKMPKAKYEDSMEFLRDAMNHPRLPIAARADYAKALLPYQHARIGEKGKKEKAGERAKEIAQGRRGRYGTKEPPVLKAIQGGKK